MPELHVVRSLRLSCASRTSTTFICTLNETFKFIEFHKSVLQFSRVNNQFHVFRCLAELKVSEFPEVLHGLSSEIAF